MNQDYADFGKFDWRRWILFVSAGAMIVSLLLPRAYLSNAVIIFVAASFLHRHYRSHLDLFFSSPILWSMSLLFLLPLISGLWSSDTERWTAMMRIKLPLLFLPLAFASPLLFGRKPMDLLVAIYFVVILAGTAWSMADYLVNMKTVAAGYLKAKMMWTPVMNDHIRFSWMVTIAILAGAWLLSNVKHVFASNWIRIALITAIAWMIIYQHILAARTGLFTLYAGVIVAAIALLFRKRSPQFSIAVTLAVVALPFAAYYVLPTFKNRVRYIRYDASFYTKSDYLPGSNDGSRYFSFIAGWEILSRHPFGVGWGDVREEADKWYARNLPQMPPTSRVLPHSQWLMYGSGCGWPGVAVFGFAMLIPFLSGRHRRYLFWWLINISVVLVFLFDIGLEIQFGVFFYSFLVLFSWRRLSI